MKNKLYHGPSNFFKIARTIFEVIIFQDFVAPLLQNDAFDLQTSLSGRPALANGRRPRLEAKTASLVYLRLSSQKFDSDDFVSIVNLRKILDNLSFRPVASPALNYEIKFLLKVIIFSSLIFKFPRCVQPEF